MRLRSTPFVSLIFSNIGITSNVRHEKMINITPCDGTTSTTILLATIPSVPPIAPETCLKPALLSFGRSSSVIIRESPQNPKNAMPFTVLPKMTSRNESKISPPITNITTEIGSNIIHI